MRLKPIPEPDERLPCRVWALALVLWVLWMWSLYKIVFSERGNY